VTKRTDATVDPEQAHQRAVQAGLMIQRSDPLNGETSIPALTGDIVQPTEHHYVRNHFRIPSLAAASWRLGVTGLVDRPLTLTLDDLRRMPSQRRVVTLECAGNGRSLLRPAVEGEPWGLGAVSTAEWTGVALSDVLRQVDLKPEARQVIFRGADGGAVAGHAGITRYERSLSLEEAREFQPLLAYAMNGGPLPVQHGFPLRLVVPGWYGVASVKWLTVIELVGRPFSGHFQTERYFYDWGAEREPAREPVTLQRVRALITEPSPDQELSRGAMTVRGLAWSGAAPIARVEVRIDDGSWEDAQLVGEPARDHWQRWELRSRIDRTGALTIHARATDRTGRTQPAQPEWNRLGYGANPVQAVTVRVR
jgi:DMSO/TMAO reductase YedYZ molybdopterin-dependent catalytic subunit